MKKTIFKLSAVVLSAAVLFTTSCKKPAATLAADKTTVAVGEPVVFTNTSEGAGTTFLDFGDGTSSTTETSKQTHAYSKPGTYNVTLTVAKKNGKKPSEAPLVITVKGPVASFTVSNVSPVAGEVVVFTSSSTDAATLTWDFGNGTGSTVPTATTVYSKGGVYYPSLTATDKSGLVVSVKTMTVTVGGVSGDIANEAKIAGNWKLASRTVTDTRNGTAFTSTTNFCNSIPTSASSTTYSLVYDEFTVGGKVNRTDVEGNLIYNNANFSVLDATRMTFSLGGENADGEPNPNNATYVVTANSLVITFVSKTTLGAYSDLTNSCTNNHGAGEKQVVTTVYTYSK